MKIFAKRSALSALLALSFAFAGAGLPADEASGGYQKILLVRSDASEFDRGLGSILLTTFKILKLNVKCIGSESYELGRELAALGPDDLLVVATENLYTMERQSVVPRFVSRGGKAFFACFAAPGEISMRVAGVEGEAPMAVSTGMKAETPLFPGLENTLDSYTQGKSSSMDFKLLPGAKVVLRASDGRALAWSRKFGLGNVVVFNSSLFSMEGYNGTLMQLLSLADDYFLTTVFNAKVFFIDDFPAPAPLGTEYVIASNYGGIGYDEFYEKIWWPQMKELAVKRKLVYTCLALGNYENSVEMPPKPLSAKMKRDFKYYGEDILKNGHELGIHGYNHASLLMANYKTALAQIGYIPWNSVDDMERSLRALRNALDEALGKRQYHSYVPPMNMLAKEGKEAVLRVFPEMKSFDGLGDSSTYEPGVLHQSIGPDPDFPKVYDLPRFSSGYLATPEVNWQVFNYLASFGLLSHFVHPDELMDSERNANKDWAGLHAELDGLMASVNGKCPFLRPMSANDFVEERQRTDRTEVRTRRKDSKIIVEYLNASPKDPLFHYLRLNDGSKVKSVENGAFVKIESAGELYLLRGDKSPLLVELEEPKKDSAGK